jgi:hypothetical protein
MSLHDDIKAVRGDLKLSDATHPYSMVDTDSILRILYACEEMKKALSAFDDLERTHGYPTGLEWTKLIQGVREGLKKVERE